MIVSRRSLKDPRSKLRASVRVEGSELPVYGRTGVHKGYVVSEPGMHFSLVLDSITGERITVRVDHDGVCIVSRLTIDPFHRRQISRRLCFNDRRPQLSSINLQVSAAGEQDGPSHLTLYYGTHEQLVVARVIKDSALVRGQQ